MKEGTAYAARLKKAYARLRAGAGSPPVVPDADDPLRRLAVAVLGVGLGDDAAEAAVERMLAQMTDWNEVRVSQVPEILQALGISGPAATNAAQHLRDALQGIYQRENRMSLDRLRNLGRREARAYLEGIKGLDAYAVASICLWSLGGHAIPVDDRLLAALRTEGLVHPEATRDEVQAFLERHVSAADAKGFCVVMRGFGAGARRSSKKSDDGSAPARKRARA